MNPRPPRNVLGCVLAVVVPLVVAGCGDPPRLPPGRGLSCSATADAGPPSRLVVIATDYNSGEASAIDLGSLRPLPFPVFTTPGATAHVSGDTIARSAGRMLVLLDRSRDVGDNATFFDIGVSPPVLLAQVGLLTVAEAGSAPGSRPYANAHDVMVVNGCRAYITRWQLGSLAVMSLATGAITGTIDLMPYRGTAPAPEADALAMVNGEAWVTLERLDDELTPTQHGMVVRVDPLHDRVTGTIPLPVANPVGPMLPAPDGSGVVVAAPGDYHRLGDGGVVRVTSDGVVHPLVVREDDPAVMGNVDGLAVLDTHRLLLKVTGIEQTELVSALPTRLIAYDLTTGTALEWRRWTLWNPATPVVVGGRVYVGDPGDLRHGGAGVRVYALDGTEITTAPVPVRSGLIPYDLRAVP